MASLKSHPNKAVNNIDFVDERSTLYYSKYQYRARLTCAGLNRTYYTKTFDVFKARLDSQKTSHRNHLKVKAELDAIDLPSIERYIEFRNKHTTEKPKQLMIRVEGNTAAIFSNDLTLLRTIETIAPSTGTVDYTEVDQSIPQGTKYYKEKPKHNYRVYVKSKRVDDATKDGLRRFIDRYKNTDTVVVPSGAFADWLNPSTKTTWYWNNNYMSSHYFLDFDQESTDTLFALMFGELIHRRFKLEKRPE